MGRQAQSHNKALEKQQLWKQKEVEDRGSRHSLSLKSNDGEVRRTVTKLPASAQVSSNDENLFEEERKRNAKKKGNAQLDRFCDGQDSAWRPDNFFFEMLEEPDLPWGCRPAEVFNNPTLLSRLMAAYKARKTEKAEKKKKKEEKKEKKDKKDKKDKKAGKM